MARCQLRVYHGPESPFASLSDSGRAADKVRVSLGEILPLLADAVSSKRTWLRDFADEELEISTDLYEVILAYQHCRRLTV